VSWRSGAIRIRATLTTKVPDLTASINGCPVELIGAEPDGSLSLHDRAVPGTYTEVQVQLICVAVPARVGATTDATAAGIGLENRG
jgi:hypothetical protein